MGLKMFGFEMHRFHVAVLLMFLFVAARATAQTTPSACESLPHADHPKVMLSNGPVYAVVFLPDAKSGYYRGSRFDWAGVVGCLSYNGHTYFGEWFRKYDPLLHDAITGPVEEFRSDDGGLGYSEAKAGELFVKPGVGVLRKTKDEPYQFVAPYPLVDSGKWTFHAKRDRIVFTQRLTSPIGIAYIYEKTLRLEKDKAEMVLEHRLKNVGSKAIDTDVYDHDFFILDGKPTGPGMVVKFSFTPTAGKSLGSAAAIQGKEVVYKDELQPGQSFAGYLKGYSDNVSDYDFTVVDRKTGVGVQQTSDSPISKFYLWSIRTTICPEAYIHLQISPGKTQSWKIRYRFFADEK